MRGRIITTSRRKGIELSLPEDFPTRANTGLEWGGRGLHDAVAQSVSPHLMMTFSDYGNLLGQLHAIYGLVGVGEDQTVAPFGVSVFPHGP